MDQEKKPILMAQMGVEVCGALQHNLLSPLDFWDQKNPKNTLLKVRNVGFKVQKNTIVLSRLLV